jgi:hypothetical protein
LQNSEGDISFYIVAMTSVSSVNVLVDVEIGCPSPTGMKVPEVTSSKSSRKRMILVGVGLAAVAVIAVGGFQVTRETKNSQISSSVTPSEFTVSAVSTAGVSCSVVNSQYLISNVPEWTGCVDNGTGEVYAPTANGLEIQLPWAVTDASVSYTLGQTSVCRQSYCFCVGSSDHIQTVNCSP